jgi:hypothetical protein
VKPFTFAVILLVLGLASAAPGQNSPPDAAPVQPAPAAPTTSPAIAPAAPAPPAPARPAAAPPPASTPAAVPAAGTPGKQCVQPNYKEVREELWSGRHPVAQIDSSTYFLPAGADADIVVNEPFRDGATYFAYMERIDGSEKQRIRSLPEADALRLRTPPDQFLDRGQVSARAAPEDHPVVRRGLASKGDTLLTLRIPRKFASLWRRADLYVYRCEATGSPRSVSMVSMRVSSPLYSALTAWPTAFLLYVLAAFAARRTDAGAAPWWRYLDPVTMTAGADGRGSLSKLQILFFSMIVFGLLAYIVARSGVLSDLSASVLLLLGITGVGSAAAKGTDAQRDRISFDNRAWLVRKGWLAPTAFTSENKASWYDIVSSDGEFDVFRYQNVIFSMVVGVALITAGINELASFTIPENLLGILGLSQVVYIGGKLVTKTSVGELNDAITALRDLEAKLAAAVIANPDPTPAAGGDVLTVARRRAGDAYATYMRKAEDVRLQFLAVTGRPVDDARIAPTLTT